MDRSTTPEADRARLQPLARIRNVLLWIVIGVAVFDVVDIALSDPILPWINPVVNIGGLVALGGTLFVSRRLRGLG